MIGLVLTVALCAQSPAGQVSELVQRGAYLEALRAADLAHGAERDLLLTWTRHQAGDLTGALAQARAGLTEHPQDAALLEQASWLSTSLFLGEEALGYAKRLSEIGHQASPRLLTEAQAVVSVEDELEASVAMAMWVLGLVGAALLGLTAYGMGGVRRGSLDP